MMRCRMMFAAVLLAALGCSEEEPVHVEPVPLDKLPAGALDTAKKQLPNVKFERARKVKFRGQDAYEVIGKDKQGKIREIEVSTKGEVLEVE